MSTQTDIAHELDTLLLSALRHWNGKEFDPEDINAALVRIARDRVRDLKVSLGNADSPGRTLVQEAELRLAGRDIPDMEDMPDAAVG